MALPKVTVVLISYHERKKIVLEAMQSYLDQKGVDLQVIVSLVKGDLPIVMATHRGFDVVVNERPGIFHQINSALSKVTGDWFAVAASSDVALPTKLRDEVACCQESGRRVCYSAYHIGDRKLNVKRTYTSRPYDYAEHLQGNFVPDDSLISRDILLKYTPFREEWGTHGFHDFWLRVYEGEGNVFVYNSKPEWIYRQCQTSVHRIRQQDPESIRQNEALREEMLAYHRRLTNAAS